MILVLVASDVRDIESALTAVRALLLPQSAHPAASPSLQYSAAKVETLRRIRDAFPGYGSWDRLRAVLENPNNRIVTQNKIAAATHMGKTKIMWALRHASDEVLPYRAGTPAHTASG